MLSSWASTLASKVIDADAFADSEYPVNCMPPVEDVEATSSSIACSTL
jgi:hypothetical protein